MSVDKKRLPDDMPAAGVSSDSPASASDAHAGLRRTKDSELEALLQHPQISRATASQFAGSVPTGFAALDHLLGGGWPANGVTELFVERYGSGEMSVLLPGLLSRSENSGLLVWVAPPYIPYAPALQSAGFDLSRVVIVNADDDQQAVWSIEQAVKSSACVVVLGWASVLADHALRRLQLAAGQHDCWVVLFRPLRCVRQASVASLRLRLIACADESLLIQVLKNRGAAPGEVRVSL